MDPCTNHWYGIDCNYLGEIISMHFFENRVRGYFPTTFSDLINLRYLTILNDGIEHEGVENKYMNMIALWDDSLIG